jgi:flagellar basal-body rod modification protein FlgD
MAVDISNYLATQGSPTTQVASNSSSDALVSGQANQDSSYQTFLTLLTSQLKNQDPTSPLDTNSFTQQLVQMTGVQQQLLSNNLLQQLVNQAGGGVAGAVGLIGQSVTAQSDTGQLVGGQASWGYNLASNASKATITISDSTGKVVWSGAAPDLGAGDHAFTWDGKTSSGAKASDGVYKINVTAINANGASVAATTSFTGVASSLATVNGQTMLNIGPIQVPLTAVTGVTPIPKTSTASNDNGNSSNNNNNNSSSGGGGSNTDTQAAGCRTPSGAPERRAIRRRAREALPAPQDAFPPERLKLPVDRSLVQ